MASTLSTRDVSAVSSAKVMRRWSQQRARLDWCHSARGQPEAEALYDYDELVKAARADGVTVKREKMRRQLRREKRLRSSVTKAERAVQGPRIGLDSAEIEVQIKTPKAGSEHSMRGIEVRQVRGRRRERGKSGRRVDSAPPTHTSTEDMNDEELARYGKELLDRQMNRARSKHIPGNRRKRGGSAPPVHKDLQADITDSAPQTVLTASVVPSEGLEQKSVVRQPSWRTKPGLDVRRLGRCPRPERYSSVAAARAANDSDRSISSSFITSAIKSARAAYYGSPSG